MVQVKKYKAYSGDFKKATIKIKDEKTYYIFSSAITKLLLEHHLTIEKSDNAKIKSIYQDKFDELEDILNKFNKPTIVKVN